MKEIWCKICGLTRAEDAQVAIEAGADAIGLNFWPGSRRAIDVARAREICAAVDLARLHRRVHGSVVALFVNPSANEVNEVIEQVPVDLLQFHGDESNDFCKRFGLPFMKVLRVAERIDPEALFDAYPDASMWLLDTFVESAVGGTGESYDWNLWPQQNSLRLVLAGGLDPDNVTRAIDQTAPFGVDVCTGVETGEPGVKDPTKIRRFVAHVRRCAA